MDVKNHRVDVPSAPVEKESHRNRASVMWDVDRSSQHLDKSEKRLTFGVMSRSALGTSSSDRSSCLATPPRTWMRLRVGEIRGHVELCVSECGGPFVNAFGRTCGAAKQSWQASRDSRRRHATLRCTRRKSGSDTL